jgi:hypothetical protein
VALVERRPDLDAYKTVCTHYIQPSATPTIERLGLAGAVEERGAVRNSDRLLDALRRLDPHRTDTPHGYNVTRRVLDPLLRRMTAETPGVELLCRADRDRAARATAGPRASPSRTAAAARRELRARSSSAADGRDSRVARHGRRAGRVRPHNRFFYWAYWRGVRRPATAPRMWFMEPDCAYTFPNEDGLTVVLVGPHRDRLPEFRSDLEGAYLRYVAGATRRADLRARRASPSCSASSTCRTSAGRRRAPRPRVRRRRRARAPTRCGASAAGGRSRARTGSSRRPRPRSWTAATSTPRSSSYSRLHRRRLGPHHFLIADLARRAPPIRSSVRCTAAP